MMLSSDWPVSSWLGVGGYAALDVTVLKRSWLFVQTHAQFLQLKRMYF
jgi:hypothetical protein